MDSQEGGVVSQRHEAATKSHSVYTRGNAAGVWHVHVARKKYFFVIFVSFFVSFFFVIFVTNSQLKHNQDSEDMPRAMETPAQDFFGSKA